MCSFDTSMPECGIFVILLSRQLYKVDGRKKLFSAIDILYFSFFLCFRGGCSFRSPVLTKPPGLRRGLCSGYSTLKIFPGLCSTLCSRYVRIVTLFGSFGGARVWRFGCCCFSCTPPDRVGAAASANKERGWLRKA
jgi:hypothetical protein